MKHGTLAVLTLLFSTGLLGQSALPTPLPDSDGGNSWTCTTDALRMPGLGINSIVGDPNDPDIVYFASGITGAFQDPKYGMGLWKSEDGGDTWQSTSLSFDAGPAAANDNLAYKVILVPPPTGGDAHLSISSKRPFPIPCLLI